MDTTLVTPVLTVDNTIVFRCDFCGYQWKVTKSFLDILQQARNFRAAKLQQIKKSIEIKKQLNDILKLEGVEGISIEKQNDNCYIIVHANNMSEETQYLIPQSVDGLKVKIVENDQR